MMFDLYAVNALPLRFWAICRAMFPSSWPRQNQLTFESETHQLQSCTPSYTSALCGGRLLLEIPPHR
jgi:hypothetical protein